MIFFAMALAAAVQLEQTATFLEGQCEYPSEMGQKTAAEQRLPCDSVVLSPGKRENDVLVQFIKKGGTGPIGFAGEYQDETMTIRRIYLKPTIATAATSGRCKMFYNGAQVSGISCVGWVGPKSYVANFRAFAF